MPVARRSVECVVADTGNHLIRQCNNQVVATVIGSYTADEADALAEQLRKAATLARMYRAPLVELTPIDQLIT